MLSAALCAAYSPTGESARRVCACLTLCDSLCVCRVRQTHQIDRSKSIMSYYEPQFPSRVQGQDTFETRLAPAVQPHERTSYARSTSKDSIAVTPILEARDTYNRAS